VVGFFPSLWTQPTSLKGIFLGALGAPLRELGERGHPIVLKHRGCLGEKLPTVWRFLRTHYPLRGGRKISPRTGVGVITTKIYSPVGRKEVM